MLYLVFYHINLLVMVDVNVTTLSDIIDTQWMDEAEKKWLTKMSDLILKNIFNWTNEDSEEFKSIYRNVASAYTVMKDQFAEIMRDDWERYFEHLRAVTNIVLDFIPNPNREKVLIALLHDAIEDIPEFDFKVIKALYWPKIAIAVQAVSKNNWKDYLNDNELSLLNNLDTENQERIIEIEKIWKERRNKEYFGHIDSIESMIEHVKDIIFENWIGWLTEEEIVEIAKNAIDVKLADRIHNLSTQWDENNVEKTIRKIKETKDYFLKIAKETNSTAFDMIKSLILDLETKVENYNKRVENILID